MVIAVAILVSGFVSLSLTPMLCSRFLRPPETGHHGRLFWTFEHFFNGMLKVYDWTLKKVLSHRRATMAVTVLTLIATLFLFRATPKGFIPGEDTGQILASSEADQGISFDDMIRHQQALAKIIREDPNLESFNSTVGAGGPNLTGNTGRMFIRLKPRSERKLSADQVIQELRPQLAKVPGIQIYLVNPPVINIGGRISKALYQYTLQSPNPGIVSQQYHT